MNRSESKYFHTAAKMDQAFIELLADKEFQYITVKEICQRAGVHRSTFYLHYETMGDLLEESLRSINEKFLDQFKSSSLGIISRIRECRPDELYLVTPEYLVPYLQFVQENKALFRTVADKSEVFGVEAIYSSLFRHIFDPILERFHVPGEQRKFLMAFYIHGRMAIVSEWLKNDCAEPISEIIRIMERCVMSK